VSGQQAGPAYAALLIIHYFIERSAAVPVGKSISPLNTARREKGPLASERPAGWAGVRRVTHYSLFH
jgi:hypothetical protein